MDRFSLFAQRFHGLESRMTELEVMQDSHRDALRALERLVDTGFGDVNGRVDRVEARLEALEGRLGAVESRLETFQGSLERIEGNVAESATLTRLILAKLGG